MTFNESRPAKVRGVSGPGRRAPRLFSAVVRGDDRAPRDGGRHTVLPTLTRRLSDMQQQQKKGGGGGDGRQVP